jgi:hypothetical protein
MTWPARAQPAVTSALFDAVIVLLYALCLGAPRLVSGRTAATGAATAGTETLAWLALPVRLARHGLSLQYATIFVTSTALALALLGTLLSLVSRMRGSASLWALGSWLFGCSVAILMPAWVAAGFLGALLLLVVLRSRLVLLARTSALFALLAELWPLGYAAGFAALAWRYNPQLLLQCLLIAFGASLVARALLPAPRRPATA